VTVRDAPQRSPDAPDVMEQDEILRVVGYDDPALARGLNEHRGIDGGSSIFLGEGDNIVPLPAEQSRDAEANVLIDAEGCQGSLERGVGSVLCEPAVNRLPMQAVIRERGLDGFFGQSVVGGDPTQIVVHGRRVAHKRPDGGTGGDYARFGLPGLARVLLDPTVDELPLMLAGAFHLIWASVQPGTSQSFQSYPWAVTLSMKLRPLERRLG